MNPDDAFERILASLYEAAIDDALWPAATTLIEEAIGASGSILAVSEGFGGDARVHFARYLYRGESRPERVRAYFDVYHAQDEGIQRVRQLPHGRLVHGPELYTEDQRKTSAAYNEGLRILGCQNGLTARFDGPDGLRIVWGAGDPVGSGGYEAAQLRLVGRLLPHVHRTVLVRQALAAAEALGAGLAGLLDNNRIGVVQLDRSGRVLAANGPALEILRRGDGLLDRDGVLQARLPADRSRLRSLLARALPDLWGEAPSGGSMTVQRPSGRSRLGLHVSPVGDPAGDFGGRRVAALALLVDPAGRVRIDAQRVAAALGLTPSEARVSALLAEGLRAQEIAAAAGLAESYVRWLFQQVYRKLGVSGQVALVRQVLAADALPRR
ncbi:MAG: helix-turn-helix transcriptional regulator [Alphaproteobacteria bacterium]|nr:helix-turn-helix transcriptional regulator [Alphaproteobacteria bacterium]